MANTKKVDPFIKEIADKIIAQLEAGTDKWKKSWESIGSGRYPVSAISHKPYNGINAVVLMFETMAKGYTDNRWLTLKQIHAKNGKLKKDAVGVKCVHCSPVRFKATDHNGDDVFVQRMAVKHFVLYNVEQTEGLVFRPRKKDPNFKWDKIEAAEKILNNSKAKIIEKPLDSAFYDPEKDHIVLPYRKQFKTNDRFYDTALHELGHWTGHKTRLKRDLTGKFGSEKYAKEELRAEIASMMISATIGLPHNIEDHAAYVNSWIKVLKDDPKEIFKAATAANKIKDYLIKFVNE